MKPTRTASHSLAVPWQARPATGSSTAVTVTTVLCACIRAGSFEGTAPSIQYCWAVVSSLPLTVLGTQEVWGQAWARNLVAEVAQHV